MIIAQGQRDRPRRATRVHDVLSHRPRRSPSPPTRSPCRGAARTAGGVRSASRRARSPTARTCPTVLDGLDLVDPAGRVRRPRRAPPGRARPPSPGCMPRFYDVDGGTVPARRRRRARRCGSTTSATPWASCSRTRSSSPTPSRANIAFADPDAAARRSRAGRPRWPGPHEFIERPARGLRHRRSASGLLACPAASASASPSPGRSSPTPRAGPRRRHLGGRPDQGARDPRRPRRGDAGPHHARHRPPPGHHRAGRPGGAARRRAGRRRRHPRRRCLATSARLPRGARGRRPARPSGPRRDGAADARRGGG